MDININGKRFTLSQATVNNRTDIELAKFCAGSDDPVVRELAYRLGRARGWRAGCPVNGHDNRAVSKAKGFTVVGTQTGRFESSQSNIEEVERVR